MEKVLLLCGLLAVIVLGIQLALCLKSKKKVIKLIPVFIIVWVYVVALLLCLLDVLNGSGGVAIWSIFAFIIAIANTVALVADAVAWIIYKLRQVKNE